MGKLRKSSRAMSRKVGDLHSQAKDVGNVNFTMRDAIDPVRPTHTSTQQPVSPHGPEQSTHQVADASDLTAPAVVLSVFAIESLARLKKKGKHGR